MDIDRSNYNYIANNSPNELQQQQQQKQRKQQKHLYNNISGNVQSSIQCSNNSSNSDACNSIIIEDSDNVDIEPISDIQSKVIGDAPNKKLVNDRYCKNLSYQQISVDHDDDSVVLNNFNCYDNNVGVGLSSMNPIIVEDDEMLVSNNDNEASKALLLKKTVKNGCNNENNINSSSIDGNKPIGTTTAINVIAPENDGRDDDDDNVHLLIERNENDNGVQNGDGGGRVVGEVMKLSSSSTSSSLSMAAPSHGTYNDYVNKMYADKSRRQSIENDIELNPEQVGLLIQSTTVITNPHPAPLKSIVKSPSSISFNSKSKQQQQQYQQHNNLQHRLSLQCSTNDTSNTTVSNGTTSFTSSVERPVLHVQFMSHSMTEIDSITNGNKKSNPGMNNNLSVDSSDSSSSSSSSSSEEDGSSIGPYAEARAPDGGWGWVVVFASFMINMIADGITFSFGVIFVEFLNYFGEGKAKTAWIGSLFMAIPLLSGPIASFLTDRYGCRKVTIVGALLASLGFVLSAFANSMEMLFFTFGILAGFGLSLCYVAAVVIVAYYFEKKRSFATGLSVCGSGIGTFIFAPLTQMLIEAFGWRGTTLILAGVFLNMIIFGLLMRDLEWTTYRAKKKAKEKKTRIAVSAESFSVSNSTNTGGTASNIQQHCTDGITTTTADIDGLTGEELKDCRLFSSLVTLPTFIKNGEKVPLEVLELLSTHQNVHALLLQNYPHILHSRSFSEPYSSHSRIPVLDDVTSSNKVEPPELSSSTIHVKKKTNTEQFRKDQAMLAWIRKNAANRQKSNQPSSAYLKDLRMHRHSLTYRGAMLNINRYRLRASSCPDIYRNSMTTIAKEKLSWTQGVQEFKRLFLDIMDFSYFADIRFLLFAISNFLLYTWYDVPYVYLTDNAIEMGIQETDASFLVSIIGIVNMFGEIFLGWIGDVKGVSAGIVYAFCMALCGAVTAMVPLSSSYTWLCGISGFFGLFIAANYALTSIILVELITIERFTNAYGLLLLVQGLANLVGPPLAGWIYDVTGTYDLSFYIAGFFIALSGVILIIVPTLNKYRKYRALRRQQSTSDIIETPKISADLSSNKINGAILSDCFNKEILKDTVKVNNL